MVFVRHGFRDHLDMSCTSLIFSRFLFTCVVSVCWVLCATVVRGRTEAEANELLRTIPFSSDSPSVVCWSGWHHVPPCSWCVVVSLRKRRCAVPLHEGATAKGMGVQIEVVGQCGIWSCVWCTAVSYQSQETYRYIKPTSLRCVFAALPRGTTDILQQGGACGAVAAPFMLCVCVPTCVPMMFPYLFSHHVVIAARFVHRVGVRPGGAVAGCPRRKQRVGCERLG